MNFYVMTYRILKKIPHVLFGRIGSYWKRRMLKSCGENVHFGKRILVTNWQNCSIGSDVNIGPGAVIFCSEAPVSIGSHVILGPNITLVTGDHRTDIPGRYISDVKACDKLPENDQPIVIEDDVWIAANATILKGVRIHEGAVIAAGAVVNKDVQAYTVVGGVPAKVIAQRFTPEQKKEHLDKIRRR